MIQPFVMEIPFCDPLVAFEPFAEEEGSIFLDSARINASARHSFIAVSPWQILTAKNNQVFLDNVEIGDNPWMILNDLMNRFKTIPIDDMPLFQGGCAGYFGYELAHHLELFPFPTQDDQKYPDLCLGFYDVVAAFDLLQEKAWIFSSGLPFSGKEREGKAEERAAWLAKSLGQDCLKPFSKKSVLDIESNFDQLTYEKRVQQVIDYIYAGDIYQANMSRRFQAKLPDSLTAFDIYQRLRKNNPAPFAAFLSFLDITVVSASPERFIKIQNNKIETKPIKGTRPRSLDPAEDRQLAEDLQRSEKDQAENIMIVDLLRNDLSRVCKPHSVKVPKLLALESYATVHHLVSTVEGILNPIFNAIDVLKATFPGGSITGVPKIRAMEIISELEPTYRGPYCGALGYIGFDGNMDTSIIIRTYSIKEEVITFQSGGGIVADSDPVQEYDETTVKAAALKVTLS